MNKVNLTDLNKEIARLRDNFHDINHGLSIREEKTLAYLEQLASLMQNPYTVPEGWKMVPIEPTEAMVINGFESEPDDFYSKSQDWNEYVEMSGCEKAAHRAKLCYSAMLASAPEAP